MAKTVKFNLEKRIKRRTKKNSKEFPTDLFVQMPLYGFVATDKKNNLDPEDGERVGIYALTGILRVKKTVTLE